MEEINEKRTGMVARLKVAEKEKEGLQGKKEEAEMFLTKQVRGPSHGEGGVSTPSQEQSSVSNQDENI